MLFHRCLLKYVRSNYDEFAKHQLPISIKFCLSSYFKTNASRYYLSGVLSEGRTGKREAGAPHMYANENL